jgi:galactose mutarotase-like enzyme
MVSCRIEERLVEGIRAVVLENELLRVTVLPEKGADVYEFVYKPKNVDFLWKTPWGIRRMAGGFATADDSRVAWMENYEGGWQEIFPNGGGPSRYKGVEMNFHGEASTLPWSFTVLSDTGSEASVLFSAGTYRSPFRIERRMTLISGEPKLRIAEKVTNWSEEEMDYMWGHHPALGAPFLEEGVMLDVPAQWVESQDMENEATRLPAKTRFRWPDAEDREGNRLDLSVVPPKDRRSADLAFLGGLQAGWYAVTNPRLKAGFGMVWPKEVFPHLWFWQEFRGSFGWPWYGSAYVMALEPFTSYGDAGLADCVENGTARGLGPGESIEVSLIALGFESEQGAESIDHDGNPHLKVSRGGDM